MTKRLLDILSLAAAFCISGSVVTAQTTYRLVDLGQLDGAGSYATGINESGVASAWLITATHGQRAARSIGDRLALVPGLENATASAEGINAQGDLSGSITIIPFPTNLIHAMRYTEGVGVADLGTLGGHQADGTSINRSGQVVGWSYVGAGYHAFLATPGQPMRDLGTLGGLSSYAGGINDAGQVSGYAQAADGSFHAFVYTDAEGFVDLNGVVSGGESWILIAAYGVNSAREIVGQGQFANQGPPRAFKLIPESPGRALTGLGPATIWVGLKNSDDVGIRFDLRAELYRNGTHPVGSGELISVPGGSSGFNNAIQHSMNLTLEPGVRFLADDTLSIQLFVRNACSGSGKNSGTARLWYDDAAANSRFELTFESPATYYLANGFSLNVAPGPGPKKTIDVAAGSKCSAFKPIGTWTGTP